MSGLTSALFAMAFTSVAWFAKGGAALGFVAGGALAYLLIGRLLRAIGEAPQPVSVRRVATACCLLWGLVLPTAFGAAGLLWGLSRGLGDVVEGPVSTTVRATTQTWVARANGLRAGVLGRYPLAKRLTDGELTAVLRAAPEWISEVLDAGQAEAALQKASSVPMPPQVLAFVRAELHALTGDHGAWLRPAIERLRKRAQGAAADRPTLEETIDAMVAPSVFQDTASTVRAAGARLVRALVLGALGLAAMLAGLLRLIWKPAARASTPGEGARG
jgi:hypothetical protein